MAVNPRPDFERYCQNMSNPKVSVLVPVYNGEKYLRECLDSILAQDYASVEILVADDGSNDGSAALLADYAARDPRIRWWKNRRNLGLVENWNCLLQEARGEYIKFVFQDDKLLSTLAVSEMAQALDDQPGVTLVACASYVIDALSQVLEKRDYFRAGISNGGQIVVRCLEQPGNLIGEPSVVMFRRSHATDGFDPQYRQIVDLEFFFRLLEQGDLWYIRKPLAAFRRHPNQETVKNHCSGIADKEDLSLMRKWFAKPWLKERATRQMLFMQMRHLQKLYGEEADELTSEMMRRLGKGWFVLYGLKRKISRPLKKAAGQTRSYFQTISAGKPG